MVPDSSSDDVRDCQPRQSACRSTYNREAGSPRYGWSGWTRPRLAVPNGCCLLKSWMPCCQKGARRSRRLIALPFRRAANQLLYLAFLRTAGVLAGLERLIGLFLFARSAFNLLAFVFAECGCVGHECGTPI